MSAAQIRFATLWRREVNRFMKIKKQTLGAPLLETFLYISVFGAALGSRIKELHGIEYIVFVIPGLIMMALAINSLMVFGPSLRTTTSDMFLVNSVIGAKSLRGSYGKLGVTSGFMTMVVSIGANRV